jgi:hypothetical protein
MEALLSRVKLNRVLSVSGTVQATKVFLRRQLWAWPILAALVLGVVGWWVNRAVQRAMREGVSSELNTILNADVTALRIWMKEQEVNATIMADAPAIQPAVGELLQVAERGEKPETALLKAEGQQAALRDYVGTRLKIFGYTDFFVVAPSGLVVASNQDAAIGMHLSGYRVEFFRKVMKGQPSVSKPFRSRLLLADAHGELKAGLPTMITAAPILDNGRPIAALAMRIRPEAQFTEILQVASTGKSGETYAFDGDGLFLSRSRFDDELKQMGLIADLPDSQSVLTLELRDPGVNVAAGKRPALKRADQPLTRMAADAVAGHSGIDVDGYRDYRGVPVVGAWAWLPEYDFGVATEVAVAEAFRPLTILRYTLWTLFGLLALSAAAIFTCMLLMARQQRSLQQAVLAAKHLGQYTLEEKIGAGGMGSVYRARHALLRRPTAVKLLDADKVSDAAVARFEREVQLTSQLNHPNTISIYDYGKTPEGIFYYAMEFLDGLSLEDLVTRFGPLPEGRVVAILGQVCGSLAEAHGIGLIHRDVKPANVLLNQRGGQFDVVKVLDFGLVKAVGEEHAARLTAANSLTGTPLYLAPEAIERPDTADARTDLYAVGAVGYFLATGTPVFQGTSIVDICMQHVRAAPEPPSRRLGRPLSPEFEAAILRCLAKKPDERPASAQALIDELTNCPSVGSWSRADAEAWWLRLKQGAAAPATPPQPTAAGNVIAQTAIYTPEPGA